MERDKVSPRKPGRPPMFPVQFNIEQRLRDKVKLLKTANMVNVGAAANELAQEVRREQPWRSDANDTSPVNQKLIRNLTQEIFDFVVPQPQTERRKVAISDLSSFVNYVAVGIAVQEQPDGAVADHNYWNIDFTCHECRERGQPRRLDARKVAVEKGVRGKKRKDKEPEATTEEKGGDGKLECIHMHHMSISNAAGHNLPPVMYIRGWHKTGTGHNASAILEYVVRLHAVLHRCVAHTTRSSMA